MLCLLNNLKINNDKNIAKNNRTCVLQSDLVTKDQFGDEFAR